MLCAHYTKGDSGGARVEQCTGQGEQEQEGGEHTPIDFFCQVFHLCTCIFASDSLHVPEPEYQGSRKMGTVGTCSQPILDFGSHFWLAS